MKSACIALILLAAVPFAVGCGKESAREADLSKMGAKQIGASGGSGPSASVSNNAPEKASFDGHVPIRDSPATAGPTLASKPVSAPMMQRQASGGAALSSMPGMLPAKKNPNLYLSSSYMGGQGERDRIEKLISEGVMVEGKRVKLEAFTRNYGQAFPIPTHEALAVTADTERTKIIQQGDRTFLQVGLQAMKGELPRRPPLNLALVIDCSGSMMDENKMEAAIAACKRLVRGLHADDFVSVIRFEDDARVVVPSTRARNRTSLLNAIGGLSGGGGTNIFAGLQQGYREVSKRSGPDSINRVILLSDGEVTSGVQDRAAFEQIAAEYTDRDIQTTAVGLGLNYNEDLMLAVAREGKGNYHFIKNSADTQTVFDAELNELTHVVAKAVKLRIVLGPGVGYVRALGAREMDRQETTKAKREEKKLDRKIAEELGIPQNRDPDKDEPGIKLLIPTFYRGDNHVVMLEIAVPPGTNTAKVADVHLKYKDLISRSNRTVRSACSISYTPHRDEMIASVNRSVKKNLLGFQTGEALISAARMMEEGRFADAVKKVDERMAVMGAAAQEWRDRDLDRDGQLLSSYKRVLSQIGRETTLAQGEFGQYLRKSLSYAGYRMTR